MRTAGVPPRLDASTELRLLMLAAGEQGCAAIEMGNGAVVRCQYPRRSATLPSAYEMVTVHPVGAPAEEPPPYAPETLELRDVPVPAGRLRGRRAERYLRGLVHPLNQHLLGFAGPSIPFWETRGDRPSMTLVEPSGGVVVERDDAGLWCRFRTKRLSYVLPLHDATITAARHPAAERLEGGTLIRALGWKPHRLLVVLTPPHEGRCYKVVAAMLPHP